MLREENSLLLSHEDQKVSVGLRQVTKLFVAGSCAVLLASISVVSGTIGPVKALGSLRSTITVSALGTTTVQAYVLLLLLLLLYILFRDGPNAPVKLKPSN